MKNVGDWKPWQIATGLVSFCWLIFGIICGCGYIFFELLPIVEFCQVYPKTTLGIFVSVALWCITWRIERSG